MIGDAPDGRAFKKKPRRRRTRRLEKTVVAALSQRLRLLGIEVKKNHGSPVSGAGEPDLECKKSRLVAMVEVKRDGAAHPTAIQRARARRLIRSGTPVYLCSGIRDLNRVVAAVARALDPTRPLDRPVTGDVSAFDEPVAHGTDDGGDGI